jgi:hypothetical protein
MTAMRRLVSLAGATAAMLLLSQVAPLQAQGTAQTNLGTVRLTRAVTADGKPLPAGSYTLRLTGEQATPVVGQTPDHWVEFVQGGQVRGRELASMIAADAIREVAEGTPPASGQSKVELLKGNDYLRVWVNRSGTHYLIHLAVTPSS